MNRHAIMFLTVTLVALSGCSSMGIPAGPLAGQQHGHENGGEVKVHVEGEVTARNTVTVQATHDDEPITDAKVVAVGEDGSKSVLGRTGDDGRLNVTVPESGHLNLTVTSNDLTGHYDSTEDDGHSEGEQTDSSDDHGH